ncbi:MAG: hypothetical protein R3317_05880, partial [Burkholderiaceae bacterium]|nr:hypothetical protein [Burkholderiaceae bacterium]
MTSKQFVPIAPRRAPISTEGVIPWIRSNLFGDLRTSIATLFFGAFLFYAGSNFASWPFAEELVGNIKTHVFYVTSAKASTEARPDTPEV